MNMLPFIEIDLSDIISIDDSILLYPCDTKGYIVDLADLSKSNTLRFRFDDNVLGVFNEYDIGFKMKRDEFVQFKYDFNESFKHPEFFNINKSPDYEMECSALKLKQNRIKSEIKKKVLDYVLKAFSETEIKYPLSLKML